MLSGLIAPFVLKAFGPGSWWIVWWTMTLLSIAMTLPLLLTPFGAGGDIADATPVKFAVRPALIYLAGYFLFGAGYTAYMTFMTAYVLDAGAAMLVIGAVASAFQKKLGRRVANGE